MKQKLEKYRKDLARRSECHCQVWEGALPYQGILHYARRNNVDLIVMGSHTSTSDEKWYAGSTVHEVSASADCPVAVVTHPQDVLRIDESIP